MFRFSASRFVLSASSVSIARRCNFVFVVRNAVAASSTFSAAQTPVVASCRRFCSEQGKKEQTGVDSRNEGKPNVLHVSDQDLALGNDMPPLLQYNENLVAAALRLVEYANNSAGTESGTSTAPAIEITPEMEAGIANIMAMLFHEEYIPLVDQFAAVRELAGMEGIRKSPQLLEAVHEITAALVPAPVMGLLKAVDADLDKYDAEALDDVNQFVLLILDGQENDDEFVRVLQTMQNRNPQLDQSTPFIVLMQKMNDVLLQSRLAHLLTEACLAFDPNRTGKIKVAELEESLKKILPKEAVEKMMLAIEGDDAGQVAYSQMTRLLLNGKDIEIIEAK